MIGFLILLISLYEIAIIIRAIFSWVRPNPYSQFVQFVHRVTDPVLAPLRRAIPPIAGVVDISPFIIIILAEIIKRFLASI